MKINMNIRLGRVVVLGFEPGSVAALAGFRSGDEIVGIGRKTGKQIPLNEPSGIDFRAGKKIKVLRDGAIVDLLIPRREKSSAKYRALKQALDEPHANADRVVQEAYAANDRGALSDPELQKICEKGSHTRARQRRWREPQLPLGKTPAKGVGPEGNFYHDQRHWRRQLDEDHDLSHLARRIAVIVANDFLQTKYDDKYFTAYPSIKTLQKRVECKRDAVLTALREIEARGHWEIRRRGGRLSNLLAPQLRALANPSNLPDALHGRNDAEPEQPVSIEEQATEDLAASGTAQNTGLTARQQESLAAGAAVLVRSKGGHLTQTKSQPVKVTPESEARCKAKAEQQEADARHRAGIDRLFLHQARPGGFQSEYNSCAYPQRQIAQGPLDNYSNVLGTPPNNRFNWYK